MKHVRTIHLAPQALFAPMRELAPDLKMPDQLADANGLAFADADGETHVYVLDADGKTGLVKMLTGGIVIANGAEL